MPFLSRRTAAFATAAAVLIAGLLYTALPFHAPKPPPAPPPLSKAGQDKLAKIDLDLGFSLARLNSSEDDAGRVSEVVAQWIRRGKLTADGADFDSALTLLDKADKLIRADPRLPAARARVLSARHRFVEAHAVAVKALDRYPEDERLQELAADTALYSGDMTGGEAGFRKLVESEARVSIPWIGLAYWAEITNDLEQAIALLDKAIDAAYPRPLGYERQAYVHSVMGEVRAKQGDMKEARRQYQWAMAKQPDYAAARTGLADVEQWEGNDAAAETLLRGLIDSESPNADYQVKLADLLDRRGRKEEAAALRREAETFYTWSVSTGYDGYLRPLANLKLAEGDFKRAAELAARDLEIRPTTESRAIYQNVLHQAQVAGKPVDEGRLHRIVASVAKPVANP